MSLATLLAKRKQTEGSELRQLIVDMFESVLDEKFSEWKTRALQSVEKEVSQAILQLTRDVQKGDKGDTGERGFPGESIIGSVGPQGEKGEKGEAGIGIKGDKGDNGKDGSPDTARQILDKI